MMVKKEILMRMRFKNYILKVLITIFSINAFIVASEAIERALVITLLPTNNIVSEDAEAITVAAFKEIEAADYEKSLELILLGIEKYPCDFSLQSFFAALLGDHSENFDGQLQMRMATRSKEIFNKLACEVASQPRREIYRFNNEYCYRFGKYKEQYENGLAMIFEYEQTEEIRQCGRSGYYYQGVGAANYAKQLLIMGDKEGALHYAQKAVVAWAQHFSYENNYYNSYVHYSLALGILGCKQDMLNALHRSAYLIQRSLDYHEFKEVIDFIQELSEIGK
jgi:hypothetical protein